MAFTRWSHHKPNFPCLIRKKTLLKDNIETTTICKSTEKVQYRDFDYQLMEVIMKCFPAGLRRSAEMASEPALFLFLSL
uniref:Uncharacterized protein n=1 Tax=Megaselia scalaris TaxID=36166 RepID=T1H388_MEGSC